MFTIILHVLGWLIFFTTVLVLGTWLRVRPDKYNAQMSSRILQCVFWFGILPSTWLGFFYPGLVSFDDILGFRILPQQSLMRLLGFLGMLAGVMLILISNLALMRIGRGLGAFFLTKRLVVEAAYKRTRNPMALGKFLSALGLGLVSCSTYFTLGTLLVVIPVLVFYLKYFEEVELALRLGQSYIAYKHRVPFLMPKLFLSKSEGTG